MAKKKIVFMIFPLQVVVKYKNGFVRDSHEFQREQQQQEDEKMLTLF